MKYALIWKSEIIEKEIEALDEARYLQAEYRIAFNDPNITIVKEL